MKKKLLVAAVGAALIAGPVVSANATTTLYGHLHMSMDRFDNDNDAEDGRMSNNSSRFGIKGDEDLGGGLKAIYQVESGIFNIDTGDDGLSNRLRNTFIGFSGSWGAVKFGRHDTPYKEIGRKLDNFNEQVGDLRMLIGAYDYYYYSGLDDRTRNGIRYETPDFNGWSGVIQNTSNDGDSEDWGNGNERTTSVSVSWSAGPLYAGLGWIERAHGGTDPETSGMRLAVSYLWNDMTFGILYEDISDVDGSSDWDANAWVLAWSMKMGNNKFKFHYGTAEYDGSSWNGYDTKRKLWAIGVDHNFSKTTMAYVNYAKMDNGNDAYGMVAGSNGGHGESLYPCAGSGSCTGTGPTGYSAGLIIKF